MLLNRRSSSAFVGLGAPKPQLLWSGNRENKRRTEEAREKGRTARAIEHLAGEIAEQFAAEIGELKRQVAAEKKELRKMLRDGGGK